MSVNILVHIFVLHFFHFAGLLMHGNVTAVNKVLDSSLL